MVTTLFLIAWFIFGIISYCIINYFVYDIKEIKENLKSEFISTILEMMIITCGGLFSFLYFINRLRNLK
jgi:heme/copper-type cytochrome/quinol oxidase subunit 2